MVDLQLLAEGVARGRYHLFLGAGASIGGAGGDGLPLPGANTLRDELVRDFDLPADPSEVSLQQAYTAARRRKSLNSHSLDEYFRGRFYGCTPPAWMRRLPLMSWQRIWTLNVDDTVENAYREERNARQRTMSYTWTDEFIDAPSQVQVVHLHGYAGLAKPQLVFSASEYQRATASRRTFHHIFGGQFTERPFIVLGARMSDEVDLSDFLRRGSASRSSGNGPSIAVILGVQPLLREELEEAGLIVLDMTAADFIAELEPLVRAAERRLAGTALTGALGLSEEARRFIAQFTPLEPMVRPPINRREFYDGWEPTWLDILDEKDAVFEATRTVIERVDAWRRSQHVERQLAIFTGSWATGKSTALLRVAREAVRQGLSAHIFRAEQAIDTDAVLWWVSRVPSTVLFFDGLADFAPDVDRLLGAAQRRELPLFLVAAERSTRLRTIVENIEPDALGTESVIKFDRLTKADVNGLLAKLAERHRLGVLARASHSEQTRHFARANHQLFTALARLTEGPGFVSRIGAELRSQRLDSHLLAVLGVVALAHEFGYALPVALAADSAGMSVPELLRDVHEGKLATWLTLTPQGLRLPHRHIATLVLDEGLSVDQRYECSLALATRLGERMSPDSVTRKSLEYRIARNILDSKMAKRWAGRFVLEWYKELEASNGWNARYWEQRAIAHYGHTTPQEPDGDLSSARAYAENAVARLPRDAYALTTLGNVVLRQAVVAARRADGRWAELYISGMAHLQSAEDYRKDRTNHSYTVAFTQSLLVAEELAEHGVPPLEVRDELQQWFLSARRHRLYDLPQQQRQLAEWHRRFLLLFAVARDVPNG